MQMKFLITMVVDYDGEEDDILPFFQQHISILSFHCSLMEESVEEDVSLQALHISKTLERD